MRALPLGVALAAAGAATLGLGERTAAEAGRLAASEALVGDGAARPLLDQHELAVPVLLAPGAAVGGGLAVEAWLLLVWAAGWVAARGLARLVVPEPWATRGTVAVALSPVSLLAATRVAPGAAAGALLAGGALLALRTRDVPRTRTAAAGAALAALAPWLALQAVAAAALVAAAATRWPRRRRRGLAALLAAEAALLSAVVYVTVGDALFGRPVPRVAAEGVPGRLGEALGGALLGAPVLLLAGVAAVVAWRWRARGLRGVMGDELVAVALCAAGAAAVWAGAGLVGPASLVAALPLLAPLAALGWRRAGRAGWAAAAVSVALGVAAVVSPRL